MVKIKVLIAGYVKKINGAEYASASVTLIRAGNLNILVDTGMDRKLLINSLKKEKLVPEDIAYIVITHTHLDHCLLAGIFSKAKILDDSSVYSFNGKMTEHNKKIPGTTIKIVSTPGHDQFHCVVLAETKEYGKVAIAGDLFWWPDDKKQITNKNSLLELRDPYLKNKKDLRASREMILKTADYLVPGHGRPFKITS